MKLGTVWFVRIGIVMLLTALVFFGNYAYQNFISKLGAGGKLLLMYLGSGLLLGLGAWLERKQESLRNYAQVLFAGGLAAVYFTTYAAHHITVLRVIENPAVDGLLLLGWAAFMAWLADRRKSELLALFAVGLAYYTSIITNVGLFTLYSNLVLTAAGVFFFVRNRWTALSFGSLVATYGGYTYWRFFVEGRWLWHLNLSNTDFQLGNLFLLAYWLLFTSAVFLSRHERFAGQPRAAFLTFNNAAFFGLVVLARLFVHTGSFWKLCLLFGGVLLGLAALARRRFKDERVVSNAYLTQGLVLVTLGFVTYFTGVRLALILAAESVVLVVLADQWKNLILRIGAFLCAGLSAGWVVFELQPFHRTNLAFGTAVGLSLAFNAWWIRRQQSESDDKSLVRPESAYFSALALLVWLVTTWQNTHRENLPLLLAVEAAALTASIYVARVPEVTVIGQIYLFVALGIWLLDTAGPSVRPAWWKPVTLIVVTLGLGHWWQRQRVLKFERQGLQVLEGVYALAVVGLLFFWLHPLFNPPTWLALSSLLAIGLTIYGALTRGWLLVACGQLFLGVSAWEFLNQLSHDEPAWPVALVPMAALVALSFSAVSWLERRPEAKEGYSESILPVALVYRWVALVMSLGWIHEYIPARERFWVLSLAGAALFAWSGWRNKPEGLAASGVFSASGFSFFLLSSFGQQPIYLPNLLAILIFAAEQQFARKRLDRFSLLEGLHTAMMLLSGVTLWRLESKWVVVLQTEGFYLTVAWALLALLLFIAGLLLRERMYRWLGLGVLGCALGRVVVFDVWKLETVYRILSFLALGVVLLVLGFIYNKYQAKFKEWL
jgi:hypothetical protein